MVRGHFRSAAAFAATVLGAPAVRACPLCASGTGERVRAGIFDADFGSNLAGTLLPFPVFLVVVAVLYFGLPGAGKAPRRPGPPGAKGMQDA